MEKYYNKIKYEDTMNLNHKRREVYMKNKSFLY